MPSAVLLPSYLTAAAGRNLSHEMQLALIMLHGLCTIITHRALLSYPQRLGGQMAAPTSS